MTFKIPHDILGSYVNGLALIVTYWHLVFNVNFNSKRNLSVLILSTLYQFLKVTLKLIIEGTKLGAVQSELASKLKE